MPYSHVPCRHLPVSFAVHSVRPASQTTVDTEELRRFQSLASKWWDEQGEFAALHAMNDLRVPFIRYVCALHCNVFDMPRCHTQVTLSTVL